MTRHYKVNVITAIVTYWRPLALDIQISHSVQFSDSSSHFLAYFGISIHFRSNSAHHFAISQSDLTCRMIRFWWHVYTLGYQYMFLIDPLVFLKTIFDTFLSSVVWKKNPGIDTVYLFMTIIFTFEFELTCFFFVNKFWNYLMIYILYCVKKMLTFCWAK